MIEIKAENKGETVDITSSMDGRAIDLMAEGLSIMESLCDTFSEYEVGTDFLFLLASAVGKQMRKHNSNEGGENLA